MEKKLKEFENQRIASAAGEPLRKSDELQGVAAQPVQMEQPTQPVRPVQPKPMASVQNTQEPQAAEQQNAGRAYQTYEESGETPPQGTPTTQPQGQTEPGTGGGYVSPYSQEIDDLYQQITGRQPFSYDIDQDAMWQSLKADYQQMGKKAMRDTMGRAAGLTGGYGSSYGQAAGQAAYDEYLTQLSERAPELYDRALNRYRQEGNDMLDRLGMLMERDANDYNRYASERAYADERADLEYQRQQREREYADQKADKEYQRQQKERDYIISLIQYGYNPTDDDLERAGMTRDEADKLAAYWQAGNPDMAYRLGLISADEYYRMTGEYPAGYTPPASPTPVYTPPPGPTPTPTKREEQDDDIDMTGRPGGTYDPGWIEPSNGPQGYSYGSGIPAQQFYGIESAISKAGSPAAARQLFDKISDSTFSNMSQDQINRLSAAMRKAGA